MRRLLLVTSALFALVPVVGAGASRSQQASWAAPQIRVVTAAGMMGASDISSFRPDDPLTAQALENLVFELQQRTAAADEPAPAPIAPAGITLPTTAATATIAPDETALLAPKQIANPTRAVSMAQLDSRLVSALGLSQAASTFARNARTAGLKVPSRFGTEVVARLLGLRLNHPASQDALELLPGDPATRAEAAYSAARILSFDGFSVDDVQGLADSFALPDLSDWQKRIITTAVARIGMPYIWGGTSDGPETEFGVTSRGGYDCSGFVWRVYKLQPYAGEGSLASVLRGRTTYQMSGEVPRSERIGLADLQPADVVFFGEGGAHSKPAHVDHMGIYLGNGWFIHSSENGVALTRLDGWYARRFAWGRRPLAEAGLE